MTRDREVKLGDLDEVPVDEPRATGTGKPPKPSPSPGKKPPAGQGRNGGNGGNGGKPPKPPKPSSGASRGWLWATLLLALIVVLLAAWFYHQVGQLQQQFDNRIAESKEQLGSLESQLSATGDSFSESADQLLATVRQHGEDIGSNKEEVRKLWELGNKRNRGWIEENREKIATLERRVENTSKEMNSLKGVQSGIDGRFSEINGQLSSMKKQLDSAVSAVNQGADEGRRLVGQLQTQMDILAENIKQLEGDNRSLRNTVSRLESAQGSAADSSAKLREIEAAIEAFDSYRLQVNNRLDRLEQR